MAQVTLTISAEDSASGTLSKIVQGLDSLGKKAAEAGPKLSEVPEKAIPAFQRLQDALQNTVHGFQQAITPATLFGTFIGYTLVHSFQEASAEVVNYVNELKRLTLVTDASTTELAALQKAAGDVGVESSTLQRAFFMLSNEIETGGSGLAKFGVQVMDSNGHMKSQVRILGEVAEGMKEMTSKNTALNAVRDVFSRQGLALMPLLTQFKERMSQATEEVEKMGLAISGSTVTAFKEWQIALHDIDEAKTAALLQVFQDMLPVLTAITSVLKSLAEGFASLGSTEAGRSLRQMTVLMVGMGVAVLGLITMFAALQAVWLSLGIKALFLSLAPFTPLLLGIAAAVVTVVFFWDRLKAVWEGFFNWIKGGIIEQTAASLAGFFSTQMAHIDNFVRWLRGKESAEEEEFLKRRNAILEELRKASEGPDTIPAGMLQKQMAVIQQLTQAQIQYAQATMEPAKAAEFSARKQQELSVLQLATQIKSGTLQVANAKDAQAELEKIAQSAMGRQITFDQLKEASAKAMIANIQKAQIQAAVADIARISGVEKAQIAADSAGEDRIRALAAKEVEAANKTFRAGFQTGEDQKVLDAATLTSKANLSRQLLDLEDKRNREALALQQASIDQRLKLDDQARDAEIAGLDDTLLARKHDLDDAIISQNRYAEFAKDSEENQLQVKLSGFDAARKAAIDNAELAKETESASLALMGKDRKEYAASVAKIESELEGKLIDLKGQEEKAVRDSENKQLQIVRDASALWIDIKKSASDAALQQTLNDLNQLANEYQGNSQMLLEIDARRYQTQQQMFDADVKRQIDANLKRTGIFQSESSKQLAFIAGTYERIQQQRDNDLKNAATVAEQQARLAGDTGAAFVAGFAKAASSAKDAFSAMRSAGQETFNTLKSGVSDFVFDMVSGTLKISDIFVNLGKRILRTMTDVFAEILVKQLAMAAGFSLPSLLGIAGTAVAGVVGFEGAPNQTAQAIITLGNAATGSAQQLTGLGGVTQLLSGIFGLFGQGLLSLLSFLGTLFSASGAAGGIAGVAGAVTSAISAVTKFGSGLLSTLGTIGGAISAIVSGLTNGTLSLSGAIGQVIGSIGVNVAASFGASAATLGSIQSASLMIGQAIPVLGAIVSAAFAIKQFLEGNLATKIAMSIGLVLGGPFGAILGGLFGGLFSGPTPQISGKTVLQPTTMAELMATQHVTKDQVVNPPGRSQFSYLDAGPIHEEMYKHRTEGVLNRDESQAIIMNILIDTLKVAFTGLDRFASQLPVGHIRDMISQRIDTILATGFEITDFNVKGDNAVNKFEKYLKALSEKTLQTVFSQVFGDIDLKTLGGGDLVKGLDILSTAIATVAAIADAAGSDFSHSSVTIQELSKNTIDFFTKFQAKDEALIDTIKRIGQSFAGIIQLINDTNTTIAVASGDASLAMKVLQDSFAAVERNAVAAADALTVAVESGAATDAVLKAGQDAMKAVNDALNAEVQAVTKLHDAILTLDKALNDGLDQFVNLEAQIRSLGGTTLSTAETIPHLIEAFDQLMAVGSKISLWAGGMKLIIAEGGNLIDQMPLISAGFNVIMQQIRGLANPQEAVADLKSMADGINAALSAGIASIQARYATLKQAAQLHIDDLNAQKTAITASYDVQLTALKAQRDAAAALNTEQLTALKTQRDAMVQANAAQIDVLKTQLSLAQQWGSVLNSVRTQLTDLYNLLAPTHPLTSLNEVRAQFDAAREAFAAGPTTEGATRVQDLAKQLIDIAKQTPGYDLPSAAFQGLAGDVQSALESIASFAVAQPSAEAIQARIAELEGRQTGSLASIDTQITLLTAQQQAATAAIDAQITTTTAQRDAAVSAIDAQIASANAALQSTLTNLSQQEQAEIVELQRIAAGGLQQIRDELGNRLLELQAQEAQASAALRAIIGDKTFEQYIAERQALALIWLSSINDTLKHYLGAIVAAIAPGATVGGIGVGMQEIKNAASSFKTLSELAQGANRPTLANALAQASVQTGAQDVAGLLTSLQRASGIMQDIPWFHNEGAGILGTFNSILGLTQNGDFQTAILSLSKLVSDVLGAGITARSPVPGFAEGLDFVPRDNFPARLHYGERVLTKEENAALGSRLNGGSSSIVFAPTITVTGFTNARQLADELESVLVEKMQSGSRMRQATKALAEGRG